jgi:hypothetical protein
MCRGLEFHLLLFSAASVPPHRSVLKMIIRGLSHGVKFFQATGALSELAAMSDDEDSIEDFIASDEESGFSDVRLACRSMCVY